MTPLRRLLLSFAILTVLLAGWSVFAGLGSSGTIAPLSHLAWQAVVLFALQAFFDLFVLVPILSALIVFSLFVSVSDLGGAGGSIIKAVTPVLVFLVILGIVNGLWFGVFSPWTELRLEQIAYQTRAARNAMEEAERLLSIESWDRAEDHLLTHRALAGDSDRVEDMLRAVRSGQAATEEARRVGQETHEDEAHWAIEMREMSVADLIARARRHLDQQDFFSAHHFATRALEQSSTPRMDARSIQAEALNAIERGALAQDEAEVQQLYRDKVRAYEAYRRGSTIPEQALEAYYRFRDLEQRIPRDRDVQRFAPLARERAQEVSFFLEDARSNQALPGRSELVFVNRRTDTGVELVSVDLLVSVRSGDYFYGVEVMRTGPDAGQVDLHMRARYGKAIGDRLVLRAAGRDGDYRDVGASLVEPEVLSGSPADMELSPVLHHDVDEIRRFAGGPGAFDTLSLPELLGLSPVLERLGLSTRGLHVVLLYRLFRIGGFFIVTIGAVGLGWRARSHYAATPPKPVLLLLPVVVWVAWWVISMLRFFLVATVEVLVSSLPLSGALLVVLVGILAAIVLALFFLAQQTVEI